MMLRHAISIAFVLAAFVALSLPVNAQENYEIQVYPYETIERGHTTDGTFPTNHQWHETIEITHGFNGWFETGFYIFTSAQTVQVWGSA